MTPAFASRLNASQSRALAVGLLVLAVALVAALLVVPALLLHRHYDDAIATLSDRLARYQRVAAQAPELARVLDVVREKNGRRFFLKNTAPNLAAAELQEMVKAAIESNGGRITTTQGVAPRDEDGFKQVGANVQFFANTANLQRILAAIESQQPYLLVATVTVRPVNAFRGFKPAPGQEPELVVQLDVVAWAYPEAAKPPAPKAAAPGKAA